jgi:hypothetical protein
MCRFSFSAHHTCPYFNILPYLSELPYLSHLLFSTVTHILLVVCYECLITVSFPDVFVFMSRFVLFCHLQSFSQVGLHTFGSPGLEWKLLCFRIHSSHTVCGNANKFVNLHPHERTYTMEDFGACYFQCSSLLLLHVSSSSHTTTRSTPVALFL